MKQRIFMTSTGTGIGKSFITAALVRQAKAMRHSVMAYKPVISGFDPDSVAESDTGLLLRSLDLPPTDNNINRVSPWRFKQPLAPSMAARAENRAIDFDAIIAHGTIAMDGPEDVVIIEGVGGVMVPLDDKRTVLDWIAALGIQVQLVTGTYLGTISHTLTALAALQQANVPVHAIILNESENASVNLQDTADELKNWTSLPIVPVTRHGVDGWQDVRELRSLI